jgi:hypothetical protein
MLVMMRFCRDIGVSFPLLQDKERARALADQLGGKAYEVTLLQKGYEADYKAILEWLQAVTSAGEPDDEGSGNAAV